MTVRQTLAIMNTAVGGGSTGYAIVDLFQAKAAPRDIVTTAERVA